MLVYEKSKGGDTRKKVRVEAVAPLIRLEQKPGGGTIRIIPNPVLVDHINSYFILKPESIFSLPGSRSVTRLRFLEFLLYHAEMKRREEVREKQPSKYEVRLQSDVIAQWLRLDGPLSANQKTRMRQTMNDLYAYGVKVEFLDSYLVEQKGTKSRLVDVLTLTRRSSKSSRALKV